MLHSIPLGILSFSSGGHQVDNGALFNNDDSEFLGRTPASDSNLKKGIISCWVKRANLSDGSVWGAFRTSGGNNFLGLIFSSDAIVVQAQNASSTVLALTTSAVFRDPHAWYHLVFVYDTTPSTPGSSDIKIFVNGEVAALSGSPTYPSQNTEFEWGNNVNGDNKFNFTIGDRGDDNFFDGYIAEFVYQDGQSFSAITDYGEKDSNGVWRPKDVSGLTFGTNGCYLKFTPSSSLGYDYSGVTTQGLINQNTESGANEINKGDMTTAGVTLGTKFVALSSTALPVVKIHATSTGFSSATIRIETGSSTAPSGTLVHSDGEVTGFTSSGSGWKTITFPNGGPQLTVGTSYWLVLANTGNWGVSHDYASAGGTDQTMGLLNMRGNGGYTTSESFGHEIYQVGNNFEAKNSPTQSNDSPTKNFAVISPLEVGNGTVTLSEGNLKAVQSGGGNLNMFGSIGFSSGKWHYEVTLTDTVDQFGLGIIPVGNVTDNNTNQFWNNGIGAMVSGTNDGKVYNNGSNVATITSGSGTDGQTFSCEIDLDNDQLEWFNNAGSSLGTYSFTQATTNGGLYLPCIHCNDNATYVVNFGASTFSKTPSTGFTGISAALLKEQVTPTIKDGTKHFQATAYEGNGTAISGTSTGKVVDQSGNSTFKPDFVWIKNRDADDNHMLYDAVRGATNDLHSNDSAAEATDTEGLSTFDGDGFTVGNNVEVNTNNESYVAWQWYGNNTSGSTNDDGNIDSKVNVNTTAGFVVGEYTTPSATAAVRTVGHGLGSNLDMLLLKNQASGHWAVWHNALGNEYLRLNATDAATGGGTETNSLWNAVTPGNASDTFSIGTNSDVNGNNVTFTFYAFRAIAGYSAFGTYTGNNSNDGQTVYLGFKPAFVLIKAKAASESWWIGDNARNGYNEGNRPMLAADDNIDDEVGWSGNPPYDALSNGFKIRRTGGAFNTNDEIYIYAAFAEHPFAGTTPATAR